MNRSLPPAVRRLVLGSALAVATLVALLPDSPAVRAAPSPPVLVAQSSGKSAVDSAREAANEIAKEATQAAREAARDAAREARESRRRGNDLDIDREYDSFDQFLDRDPALAAMVLGIVFIVFLTPILIIALVVWYKVRKNRMQNETMLKLAEKGIVPPAEAMQVIGSGRMDAALGATAASASLVEQARTLRKEAAWSDLRKGVLMGGVGLALTLYGLFDDGSPGWIGLVLLFVGIGYVVLWYFEDRHAVVTSSEQGASPVPKLGPGDTQN